MADSSYSPVLRWMGEGFLALTSLFVAAILAVVTALETKNPGVVFVVFIVALIGGLAGSHVLFSRYENEQEDQETKTIWNVLGGLIGFIVCGGITAIVLRPF